ncbi:hypothetical protein GQ457_15G023480 [Hibiscus cannabinus]
MFQCCMTLSILQPDVTINMRIFKAKIDIIIATAVGYHVKKQKDWKIIPHLRSRNTSWGCLKKLESFPHYVARQMRFKDRRACY